nr:MAG TPA: hypothetical protein [Caudoviricetes sp.]
MLVKYRALTITVSALIFFCNNYEQTFDFNKNKLYNVIKIRSD